MVNWVLQHHIKYLKITNASSDATYTNKSCDVVYCTVC